jgi:hypothetical protein
MSLMSPICEWPAALPDRAPPSRRRPVAESVDEALQIGAEPLQALVYREYRLTGGRIAEHWALLDTATLLRQIGAGPSPENARRR